MPAPKDALTLLTRHLSGDAVAGTIAYMATIVVHWAVGYTSLKHLLPAYGGLAWLWLGGVLSYQHLVGRDKALEEAWRKRLARRHL